MSEGRETASAAGKDTRDTISFWGTMIALVIAVVTFVMDILRDAIGLTYPGLVGFAMDCSFVWLPLLMLAVGYILGKRVTGESDKADAKDDRIADLEKQVRDRDSMLGDSVKRVDALERELGELREIARKIAEEKDRALRRLAEVEDERDELKARLDAIDSAEARDKAMIDEFTDAQLELMLRMADAPSPGLSLFVTSHDHTLAMSLMEPPEVVAMFIDETRSTCAWHLLPKWNGWVRRNRGEIENRLANL